MVDPQNRGITKLIIHTHYCVSSFQFFLIADEQRTEHRIIELKDGEIVSEKIKKGKRFEEIKVVKLSEIVAQPVEIKPIEDDTITLVKEQSQVQNPQSEIPNDVISR